ncbi:hypothetical protein H6764_02225 [Candidatus Nomurabacteria bacterium]|nr:hypothetical protein [Candidatus Nomurabacteria bacterium]
MNLPENFQNRKNLIIAAVIIVTAVLGIIAYILLKPKPKLEPGSVDQPLGTDIQVSVDIPVDNQPQDLVDKLSVYDIEEIDRTDVIAQFLSSIGKGLLQKEALGTDLVYWKDSPTEDYYLVEYNRIFDDVFFRFENPATPSKLGTSFVTRDTLPNFFTEFINEYFKNDFKFTNFNITTVSEGYRVEANRVVNDIPLERPGSSKYSDYIIVQEDGDIVEGSVTLFTIDSSSAIETALVPVADLGSYLLRKDYPKDFNQGFPIGLDITNFGYNPYDENGDFNGDPPPDFEIPEATSCTADAVNVVYLFNRLGFKKLTPVYRIDCTGEITFGGSQFKVPIVIYANAIDPDVVYVPAQ